MFVFLTNEHIAANFASFAIVKFSVAADSIANFGIGNILRHWGVTFIGNFIGGGLLMGLPYAFLNKKRRYIRRLKSWIHSNFFWLFVNCSGLNKKLTSGEDNRCPLHFYIQSDENSFLKVSKFLKPKAFSFDEFK